MVQIDRVARVECGRADEVHLGPHRGEAAARHLFERAWLQKEPVGRGRVGPLVFPKDDVALVLGQGEHSAVLEHGGVAERGKVHGVVRIDDHTSQRAGQRRIHECQSVRGGDGEPAARGVVREAGGRALERWQPPAGGCAPEHGEWHEGPVRRVLIEVLERRARDEVAATETERHRRPFVERPHPVSRVEREPHRIRLADVWRRAGARECLDRIAGNRRQEDPGDARLERGKSTNVPGELPVTDRHHEAGDDDDRRPEDEERPRVRVRAEDLAAEALADVACHVQRGMPQPHVDAERAEEHGEPDVAGTRPEPQDEQAGERNEDHPDALRPAEDARRFSVDEPEHEHGRADRPGGERQDDPGERGEGAA